MSEEMIIKHCSPTLAGIKTGNMFSCYFENEEDMRDSLREFNKDLVKKGLRALPLRHRANRALIYVFRPDFLKQDLCDSNACRILKDRGYKCHNPERCVAHLIKRIGEMDDFPHEVGLFLGYPPEDVLGFIEKEFCKYVGLWRVYSDVARAQKLFDMYQECTNDFYCRWCAGDTLEKLAVAN